MGESSRRLPLPKVLAFAGLAIPAAGIGLPLAVFLSPFYAEHMGLGMAATGTVFMLLRIWDLLIDPVMGYLVDARPSRLGRVRHWLLLAIPTLMISTFFLYLPAGESVSAGYLAIWLMVFFVGLTLLQTPTLAWVPALAPEYDERSRVFMWNEVVNVAALLTFLIFPAFVGETLQDKVRIMGIVLIVIAPVFIGLACAVVPDPPLPGTKGASPDFTPAAIKAALTNGPLLRILTAYVCIGIAVAGTAATYLWAAKWGFDLESRAELVLVMFFIAGMSTLPAWVAWSKRSEKHHVVMWICLITGMSYLTYLPLREIGGFWAMSVGAVLSGAGFSAGFTLLRSMLADLVEVELARSGNDRSGLYYALLSGAYKTGASMAIGIPYILLGVIVGFDPNADNSPDVIRGLMIVFVGVPFLAYCAAGLIIRTYPITREVHREAVKPIDTTGV